MRKDGFVLCLTPKAFRSGEILQVTCAGPELGTAAGSGVRLLVSTQATTPESAASAQPLLHQGLLVAISGRIDNRNAIADYLGNPSLKLQPDCTLLAEAYKRCGNCLTQNVIGEFAAVIIDFSNRVVTAFCDSLGLRRILYCHQGEEFWISSSLTMLLSSLPMEPELDRDSLIEFISRRGSTPREKTLFRGICALGTGKVLSRTGNGKIQINTPWTPQEKEPRSPANRENAAYDEEFRYLLFEAVRSTARTREPVWADLSGGLDSSTITAIAHLLHSRQEIEATPLIAFSIVHPSTSESDESAFQRAVLALHPMPQTTVSGDGRDYRQIAGIHAEPSPALTFKADVHRAIAEAAEKDRVRVNLSGIGGDQVLCNYAQTPPFSLGDHLRAGRWRQFTAEFKGYLERGERSVWVLFWHCVVRPRGLMGRPDRAVLPLWGSRELNSLAAETLAEDFFAGPRVFGSLARECMYRSICAVAQIVSSRLPPVPVDMRFPYFYRPLVEFMLRLPWEHKITPWQDRIIQRRSLQGILPEEVRNRETKAHAAPVRTRALRDHWEQLRPYIAGEKLAGLGIIQEKEFREACQRWRHGMREADAAFLPIALMTEAWLQSSLPRIREAAPSYEALQHFFGSQPTPADFNMRELSVPFSRHGG